MHIKHLPPAHALHTGIALACLLSCCATALAGEPADATYNLKSRRKAGDIDHVSLTFKAVGSVVFKAGPDVEKPADKPSDAKSGGSTGGDSKAEKLDMDLSCSRDYDEKTLLVSSGTGQNNAGQNGAFRRLRSVRAYRDAHAEVKKGTTVQNPSLRPERSLIAVEVDGPKVTAFSPRGPLAIDELDLVTAAGESLAIDRVLPEQPVKLHETWKVPDDALTAMLDLEEISESTAQMTLAEATPDVFRSDIEGHVVGKLYGATNRLDLKAKCRIDRHSGRIDWFAMKVTQSREDGVVEPGLEVNLLVMMKVVPLAKSDLLADGKLKDLVLKPSDALCRLQYAPAEGYWQVLHDRQWYLVEHFRDLDIFHRLDHGQDVGVCKISWLAPTLPAALPTLAHFQESVQKSLGANFASFVEASQGVTENGYRYYRVVAAGKDGDVPVQWIYYHVADDTGRQAAFVFRVEAKNLDTFAKSDDTFLQTLRFTAKADPKAGVKADSRPATQTGQRATAAPK